MSDRIYATSPFRLNLEQQRKRSKELLRAWREDNTEAMHRLARHHPRAAENLTAKLADAQLVVARELGLASWPRLKAHIAATERSMTRIASERAPPDSDIPTLHLRCGTDIEMTLHDAGFCGAFHTYTNPFCSGPVTRDAAWLDQRADFIAGSVGQYVGLSRDDILAKLQREERALATASQYERVVLWFEHDIFDQLILARVLTVLSAGPPHRLELVSAGNYPGSARYIGLGQLPPEALLLLWERRVPVSNAMLKTARDAWSALTAPEPTALVRLARDGTLSIPELGRAMRRFAQEYPWTTDGLALSQRLILRLIAKKPLTAQHVYYRLMTGYEPLPWLSDLMFRDLLDTMKNTRIPAFTAHVDEGGRDWRFDRLELTPEGREVLNGERDWWSLWPIDRWLGGVRISAEGPVWVWNDAICAMQQRLPAV